MSEPLNDKEDKYILDSKGNPIAEPDIQKWGKWFEVLTNRILKHIFMPERKMNVSTVFLGIDHNFELTGDPVLWETIVFNSENDSVFEMRYTSRHAALIGHDAVVTVIEKSKLGEELKFED